MGVLKIITVGRETATEAETSSARAVSVEYRGPTAKRTQLYLSHLKSLRPASVMGTRIMVRT